MYICIYIYMCVCVSVSMNIYSCACSFVFVYPLTKYESQMRIYSSGKSAATRARAPRGRDEV